MEVGSGGGGANTEQVKMNTIWVHEREAGGVKGRWWRFGGSAGGKGGDKTKAPVLPACSQRRHNTATLEVVTPPPPPAPPPKSGVRGTSRARHHSCRPPPPPTTTTTSAPSSLIPPWVQIIANGATGHLQPDSQLL